MMTDPHRHEYHSLVGGIPRNNEDLKDYKIDVSIS